MANQCETTTKNGTKCRADAQIGKSVCVFHDPARATEVALARRAGGLRRSRRAAVLPPDTPDHTLKNAIEVSEFLAASINQMRRGELDPRVANGVGYLASVLLRSFEQGPFEQRLAQLEATLGISATKSTRGSN